MANLLLILTGKTASGKDTVMSKLMLRFPDLKKVITTTSRLPRDGEEDGVDYNFISETEFKDMTDSSEFIEHVEYAGNFYGTEKIQLLKNLQQNLIWRIDPSRAGRIRNLISGSFDGDLASDLLKRVFTVYLTVDDTVVLVRLKKRGLNQEEIERRMQEDAKFWQEFKDNYDYIVENIPGELNKTVEKVSRIIEERLSKDL